MWNLPALDTHSDHDTVKLVQLLKRLPYLSTGVGSCANQNTVVMFFIVRRDTFRIIKVLYIARKVRSYEKDIVWHERVYN